MIRTLVRIREEKKLCLGLIFIKQVWTYMLAISLINSLSHGKGRLVGGLAWLLARTPTASVLARAPVHE